MSQLDLYRRITWLEAENERLRAEAARQIRAARAMEGAMLAAIDKHEQAEASTITEELVIARQSLLRAEAEIEWLREVELRWEDKYDDLCRTHERLRAKLAAAEAYGEKERRHFEDWFKRADQAEARNRDLEAERESAVQARDNWREAHDQVQARNRALEAALKKYGWHLGHCPAYRLDPARTGPCECGYLAALEGRE